DRGYFGFRTEDEENRQTTCWARPEKNSDDDEDAQSSACQIDWVHQRRPEDAVCRVNLRHRTAVKE
ncbi:unnamed protein product, partial [Durusdinium trenchii]